jgi:hypothetical protein
MSLYQELKSAGCTLDSHESDLYVLDTKLARSILERYTLARTSARVFVSALDGELWVEIPFAYEPWWTSRNRKGRA